MMKLQLYSLALVLFSTSLYSEEGQKLHGDELVQRMQQGGLILYIRHASTEKDYADQVSSDVNDGSTQRVLSEKGWHEAVHIGNAFRFHGIPVGKVYSSEYFRAWQTAWLAFGEYEKNSDFNFLPTEEYSEEEMAVMKKRVTPYLLEKPATGKNTVIVAHDDPFEAATGIYPEPQGVCFVVEPGPDGEFTVLGHIHPDGW
ncbi:MAG: histidine phosphatase family protein [Verrucomicrobiales bacterium]|nr:histidine phosphatase family protein [Verrucomicrobiales bacterium]